MRGFFYAVALRSVVPVSEACATSGTRFCLPASRGEHCSLKRQRTRQDIHGVRSPRRGAGSKQAPPRGGAWIIGAQLRAPVLQHQCSVE